MVALALPSVARSSVKTTYWLPAANVYAPAAIDLFQFTPSTVAKVTDVLVGEPLLSVNRLAVTVSLVARPLVTAEKVIWPWLVPSPLSTTAFGDTETLTNNGGATPTTLP